MRDLIIVGAGGFGGEAAWVAREMNAAHERTQSSAEPWNLLGFADSDERKRHGTHMGYTILGTIDSAVEAFAGRKLWFFCAIGDNAARRLIAQTALLAGWESATLIHPSAVIASTASVHAGAYIGPCAVISNGARIGAHSIVNMHVSVGHDVVVGDYCQLSPGSRISGFCQIEELANVGSNAVLMPGTKVGRGAVVGACSLARGEIDAYVTVCGVPARTMRVSPANDSFSQPVHRQ
jgi:sugar O-acyltransferase (sialic acid O-acetyltransferase NeuD family)